MKFVQFIAFYLFMISCLQVSGQEIHTTEFTTENGVASNEVYSVHQDQSGVLWIATDRGICSFNGYQFEVLNVKEGRQNLSVFKLFPQKDGSIYFFDAMNYCYILDPKTKTVTEHPGSKVISENSANSVTHNLYIDDQQTLYISYLNGYGYLSVDSQGHLISTISKGMLPMHHLKINAWNSGESFVFRENEPIRELNSDTKFTLRIEGTQGNYFTSSKRQNYNVVTIADSIHILKNEKCIKSIYSDKIPISNGFLDDERFWIGFRHGGVKIYNLKGEVLQHILKKYSVSDLLTDKEEGYWFATLASGILYSPNPDFTEHTLQEYQYVHNLSLAPDNGFYINYNDGTTFLYAQGKAKKQPEPPVKIATHIQYYKKNDLLMGVFGNVITDFGKNKTIEEVYIRNISDDSEGLPIFCGNHFIKIFTSKLTQYDVEGSINDACSNGQYIYIGRRNGLSKLDTVTKKEVPLKMPGLQDWITDIDRVEKNLFAVGSLNSGVTLYNEQRTLTISEQDGLSSNRVNEIYVQTPSVIWACTDKGLNRIQLNGWHISKIDVIRQHDGLVGNDITDVKIINDTVWVASRTGLSSFPEKYIQTNSFDFDHFLKFIAVEVGSVPMDDLTHLKYWQNRILFRTQAISYRHLGDLKYRYRMKGLENEWNYTSNPEILYKSIPPGDYELIVQLGIKDQWTGEIITKKVRIIPPYYDTIWFRSLITGLVLLLIYLFFRFRILSYNRHIIQELLRHLLKLLRGKSNSFIIREKGADVKIDSNHVLYVRAMGNYLEIVTDGDTHVIREKISNFMNIVPDPIEYVQVRRSHIVRIDKVRKKSATSVFVNGEEIKVGRTFMTVLNNLEL